MFQTLLVYFHLIATSVVIGIIVLTDLRLLTKIYGYRVVIKPPDRFETVLISIALAILYITGGMLIYLGLDVRDDYVTGNGKLQGKLMLVALLTANAVVLHHLVFPILRLSLPVSAWNQEQWLKVALSVSLSNSIWFFVAFLGIARDWNYQASPGFVILVWTTMWAAMFVGVNLILLIASRDAPSSHPDWLDAIKRNWMPLAAGSTIKSAED